jgi:sugar/nucleoside kinase (ribokinase family)
MKTPAHVDILMVGHFAKDQVIVDGQGDTVSGGAVYYGSVALRRLGIQVAVVTRLHRDDWHRLDELKQEGVHVFAAPAPETSGIANYYDSADMERRICKPLGFAGPFLPADIPEVPAKVYLVGPIIAGEVDVSLLKSLAAQGPVGLDVQGFVRVRKGDSLIFHPWPEMEQGLSHVTYLKADRSEAELLTAESNLCAAARRLADYGPREVVVTQSSGVIVFANDRIFRASFTPRTLAGRTGRGDTCFATYLGKRLSVSPGEACRFAAAITTLKQEQPGPWKGTITDVKTLLARWDGDGTLEVG